MKEKTLVILAAGMGSRFGGPKQFYPIGKNGEFIMDYSIYSAVKYGFSKIVFVIREEFEKELKETIGKRIENHVNYSYVFQSLKDIPEEFVLPSDRIKPLGTAHAMYCTRNEVVGNVAVISADDFYGDEAFKDLSELLDKDEYGVLSFKIAETMSSNGTVKRGVCIADDNYIKDIVESVCSLQGDEVICEPIDKNIPSFTMPRDGYVSMLMYGFTQDIFNSIKNEIETSFMKNKDDLSSFEIYLPNVISNEIKTGRKVLNISTNSKWIGLTYKEDVPELVKNIDKYTKEGIYPENLWEKQ